MLISIILTILGIFLTLTLESFSIVLLNTSLVVIILLILSQTLDWKRWIVVATVICIFVDIVLHRTLGFTLLSVSLSTTVLYLLFTIMPQKEVLLSHLPYFVSILIYYILIVVFSSFVQDGVLGQLTWSILGNIVIKSVLSTLVIFGINLLIDRFRTDGGIKI